MLRDRWLTAITVIAVAVALLILAVGYGLSSGESLASAAYAAELTEDSVMQVALTVDETEWENLLQNAEDEEFIAAEVSIDGVSYGVVGLRAKGNSSLSQVAASDSDRYSFKLDFAKYVEGNSFQGLNDLALNNMISDPSYLKEYLSYQLFEQMEIPTPLCRFAWITVNGEDWGLYLAVEQLKEDFLERNYGTDYGNLYKPDTMEIGGGAGGGERPEKEGALVPQQDGFAGQMQPGEGGGAAPQNPDGTTDDPQSGTEAETQAVSPERAEAGAAPQPPEAGAEPVQSGETETQNVGSGTQPQPPEDGAEPVQSGETGAQSAGSGIQPQPPEAGTEPVQSGETETESAESGTAPQLPEAGAGGAPGDAPQGGGFGGPSGGGGTNLVYTDDALDSYSGIFDNTETDGTTTADQERLVSILKQLGQGENLESCVDVEEVLRYFVVNTFLVNLDSYASSMKHNYYLYEEDGMISILPWDFNLSFGAYQGGDASKVINFPIDTPVTDSMENSPLIAKLLEVPEYLERYHQLYETLLSQTVDNGWYEAEITALDQMLSPYVEKDPTAFYSVEEYRAAVEQLKLYFSDRAASIRAQLAGEQPVDSYGDMETSVDMSALGSMGGEAGGGEGRTRGGGARPAELPEGEVQQTAAVAARPGGFQREDFRGNSRSVPGTELLLCGGCILLFVGGLLGARLFRRRKYRSK